MLQVKRCVQAAHGAGVFQQHLLVAARRVEDHEVLAAIAGAPALRLRQARRRTWPAGARAPAASARPGARPEPIVLTLVRLAHVDADARSVGQLLCAAAGSHLQELRRLLGLPIHPDEAERTGIRLTPVGTTALMLAAYHGHLEATQLLCDAGADKNKATQDGATALLLAAQNGHVEVVRDLCEAGADKDQAENDGATALLLAAQGGHVEVVCVLCQAEADKDKAPHDGAAPLCIASQSGHVQVVRVLCEAGADKDQAMHNGATPLVLGVTGWTGGCGACALQGRVRQGQDDAPRCHGIDLGICERTRGGGACAL